MHVNGDRVGDAVLAPGWTDYSKRIEYAAHDVTGLIAGETNVLGAILGDGWYAGFVGFDLKRAGAHYGKRPELLCELHLHYEDGSSEVVASDEHWRATTGPIRYSDLLHGEHYDARHELDGWTDPAYDEDGWRPVQTRERDGVALVPERGQPIRVTEELEPISVTERKPGVHVLDFGQNMVGWARIEVEGEAGATVRLRFAEMLEDDGSLHLANLRSARPQETYVMRGGGRESFEPHFTFHGFRYVEVQGPAQAPTIAGRVVHSDTPAAGRFECSSELVNQLWRNVMWGQRGNFLSVPTDCPQRDERLGWLGDAQVFAPTAALNMDIAAFMTKWGDDVLDAQSADGLYPGRRSPARSRARRRARLGRCGNHRALDSPPALRRRPHLGAPLGRHGALSRHPGPAQPGRALARATSQRLRRLAVSRRRLAARGDRDGVHGLRRQADGPNRRRARTTGAQGALRAAVRPHRQRRSIAPTCATTAVVEGDTQTVYLLALHVGLLPEAVRQRAVERLVADIERRDWHLTTGFIGVSLLCPVLTDAGYADVAYKLLLNETFPSWGYSIRHGATTIWERWDGWTEEHGFQTAMMNSFNHYSLGSVAQWLYEYVAGVRLDPERPGYAHVVIAPTPGPIEHARAAFRSVRGVIKSGWQRTGRGLVGLRRGARERHGDGRAAGRREADGGWPRRERSRRRPATAA